MQSRWEGFPLLPLEVFSVKKTLIGSDISGINEIIIDGVNGKLVEKDNVRLFAETTLELLSDNKKRISFGQNGFDYYMHNFSYSYFLKQYLDLYKMAMNKERI